MARASFVRTFAAGVAAALAGLATAGALLAGAMGDSPGAGINRWLLAAAAGVAVATAAAAAIAYAFSRRIDVRLRGVTALAARYRDGDLTGGRRTDFGDD